MDDRRGSGAVGAGTHGRPRPVFAAPRRIRWPARMAQPHERAAPGSPDRDLAVLGPGQLAHDVEPEADAAEPAAVAGLALDEPLEDPLPVGRRDADPLVLDRDLDLVAGLPGPHGHRPAVG